ncbi:MAG: peroxide stress protein YaaA [Acidimicrobiaceae bacterium]|nr:peroxide stress protein YaaA [Acidimicrobiia bacterium]MCY4494486.1 peroxide stress protein YaaA [Acidimicrobiaceae bacterium]
MLIVVSPAKSLDYESKLVTKKRSEPRLLDRSRELVEVMAQKPPSELSELMSISPTLAELNHERFGDFQVSFTAENARPAVLAFNGDVYLGMAPQRFSERDFTHAQKTLRILSGLYGVLRPLDLMQPYRLEMGSRVATARGRDLYGFWGDSITDLLNADIEASPGARALINLASNEYFGAVNPGQLQARLVSPVFLDSKNGAEPRIVSFFAKRARGSMAGWIIRNRVRSPKALTEFAEDGYEYDPDRSNADRPVFVR